MCEKMIKNEKNGVVYLTFPLFEKAGIKHGFSTKLGGVSVGDCATMNLSFTRGDDEKAVLENHRRFAKAVGYPVKNVVLSNQVHETKILRVDEKDCGKGVVRESDIIGIDGLITNDKKVVLMTFFADCVPLFFYDPVKKAIGASHSGWRGSVKRIAALSLACPSSPCTAYPTSWKIVAIFKDSTSKLSSFNSLVMRSIH